MKQSDKPPFFEKEDGVFVFGREDKRDRIVSFCHSSITLTTLQETLR